MSIVTDMESEIFLKNQAVWSRMDKVRVSMYKMFHMETDDPETQAYKSACGVWLICVKSLGNENIRELLIMALSSYMIEIADILQESSC